MTTHRSPARFHQRERGFTLTEVLVATTVFTIIVIAALMIYDRSNQIFKSSVESSDLQQNTRAGWDRLLSDVRMAGFDYDRDGVPTRAASGPWQPSTVYTAGAVVAPVTPNGFSYQAITGGTSGAIEPNNWPTTAGNTISGDGTVTWRALGPVYQQQDEQIEYAGRSAIVVRANYDYHIDVAHEHGRENVTGANYEPSGGQFPVVTTANDEIVIFALRSDVGSNPDTLTFYADATMPRSVYPGGNAETEVELTNVDLCASGCNNPPYTLYRYTLKTDGTVDTGVPIASNVRDLQFRYYSDIAGTSLVTKLDGTAIAYGAVGGDGQYDPAAPGATDNYEDRAVRATIVAISAQLTGMSAAPDPRYNNPNETIASIKKYRQYTLQSHITPRNLGLAGMSEPSGLEPGPPTITSVCVGSCRVTRISWAPPLSGTVRTYEVLVDTSSSGNFATTAVVVPGDVFSAPVMNLTPGTTYYFKVHAINENGESSSAVYPSSGIVVTNKTKPDPISTLAATQGADSQANQVTLTWNAPTANTSPLNTLTCSGATVSGASIDAAEPIRYRIWRGTSATFNPSAGDGEIVLDSTVATQPTGTPGSQITWVDDSTNALTKTPANCKSYWYRLQVYDSCSADAATAATYNDPAVVATGTSAIFPDVTSSPVAQAIAGYASSTVAPSAPGQPTIDFTNNNSTCIKAQNTCSVKILIPKVTTDTANPTATITVDQYRIRRERKKASDSTWVFDTYLPVVSNASSDSTLISGNNVIATDTSALDHDTVDKKKWYYRYTVSALQCGTEGAASPAVIFPESCGLASSTVIESGASSGNGSLESPWVMNASDTIQVIPPVSVNLNKVEFEIYPEPNEDPNAQPVDKSVQPNSPFVYSWNDQSDAAVYRVVITMTNDQGCVEQTERFIQDDPVACPGSTVSQTGALSGAGTEGSPWVMDAGDTITVNEPPTGTITSVAFTLLEDDSGTVILSQTDSVAPWGGTWVNQTDNVLYRLEMLVTFDGGCTQEIIRYIQDQPVPVCVGATTAVTGDASGGNNGTTQATPWLLNGGDVVTVSPPSGGTINQVAFTMTPVSPAGSALPPVTDSTSPFQLSWSDQTDNTTYRVDAVITYSTGCTETKTFYVKDQLCSGATTSQTGSVGAGTGSTSSSPWIFNGGDKITVTPPSGVTPLSVQFVVKNGATTVSTATDSTSPFEMTWSNQTDDVLYTVTIYVTYTAGCVETLTRYVTDQGKCFTTASAPVLTHADSGARRVATITYTITNPESEAVTLSGIKLNWARDAGHPTAVMTSVVFTSGASTTTETISTSIDDPPSTGLVTLAATPPVIPASSSSYTIAVNFDIGKKTDVGDLSASWISGLCLQGTAPSFGGVSGNCNLLGSTSGNPGTCN